MTLQKTQGVGTLTVRRPQGNGDLNIVRDSYTCRKANEIKALVYMFNLILYIPVNIFFCFVGMGLPSFTSTKHGFMCLAQGNNTVPPVGLEPTTF